MKCETVTSFQLGFDLLCKPDSSSIFSLAKLYRMCELEIRGIKKKHWEPLLRTEYSLKTHEFTES